ncbi:MAG: type I glyceraldehyde-3-phosphate dehydrogenase [Patescibacteria group bacterium]|jgi:glyceraldehyde 3-phosphate dehydrogenase
MVRVAINGFGRIGRQAAKLILERPELELVAVNDLTDAATLAHLLRYDTVYGRYGKVVEVRGDALAVGDETFTVFAEKDPANLPWRELEIDVVIESTGHFTDAAGAKKHVAAGAKAVVIAAPSKGDDPAPTFLRGVNDQSYGGEEVVNNASCTTNSIAPVIQVLHDAFGVERALMTTVHGYTADQNLQDGPHKDLRRARAAAHSIAPTSTGAAIATTEVITELQDAFDGVALRVPVICGSISDITAVLKADVTVEQVNAALSAASESEALKGILAVTDEPLVSSDIVGHPASAIVDLGLTRVVGNLVKVFAWYDNEFGYANRLVELVDKVGSR